MFKKFGLLMLFITTCSLALNYWTWDCESITGPNFNGMVTSNTSLVATSPHGGSKCMQINVQGTTGNVPSGADVRSIDLGPVNNGQWFYYRWWMKLDANFRWGEGSAYTKASRLKHTDEQLLPRLWTGYVSKGGVFLHESDVLPAFFDTNAVSVKYDFQNAAGKGWHEYIVAMKMQTGTTGRDGQFQFYVDGKLIGLRTGIHYMDYAENCSEAWRGWMVSPYFQLNGTSADGGLMWLDDYSMDDVWNSNFIAPPLEVPVVSPISKIQALLGDFLSFQIIATNSPVSFQAQNLPSGITLNASTGIISGSAITAGTYSVSVTAINKTGTSNVVQFTILINPQNIISVLETPKVISVEAISTEIDTSLIFSDDFEKEQTLNSRYTVYNSSNNSFVRCDSMGFGLSKHSMVANFLQSQVDAGSLILTFGKNPVGSTIKPDDNFKDLYWRFYILLENRWVGNPRKLTRATILTSTTWQQAMIGHVWGNPNDSVLNIDPATGVNSSGDIATTTYNDFVNLQWLGKKYGTTPIFTQKYTNSWICIENHIRLNTPGQKNGVFEFWVDGNLEAKSENLNWTDTWNNLGINTLMFENYWNEGSLRTQKIYWDNIVVSTKPIGLAKSPNQPLITTSKATYNTDMKAQVSTTQSATGLVWQGSNHSNGNSIKVSTASGTFEGSLANATALNVGTYYARTRYLNSTGDSSAWTSWKIFQVGSNKSAILRRYQSGKKGDNPTRLFIHNNNRDVRFSLTSKIDSRMLTNNQLLIFNVDGSLVKKFSSQSGWTEDKKGSVSFKLPALSSGTYLFMLKSADETLGKFMVTISGKN